MCLNGSFNGQDGGVEWLGEGGGGTKKANGCGVVWCGVRGSNGTTVITNHFLPALSIAFLDSFSLKSGKQTLNSVPACLESTWDCNWDLPAVPMKGD